VPVLLIHPSGATSATWGTFLDALAAVAQPIAYDRRGTGRSGGEPPGSIAVHTADAAALLEQLHAPPAVVFGTSVGATIAIDLARTRPDLVRAVVAHESPWHVTHQPPTPRQLAALFTMRRLASHGREGDAAAAFLRFAYTARDGRSTWDDFPASWRAVASEHAAASLDDIRIAIGNYPTRRALGSIATPVVCTYGARSTRTITRVTRRLARAIPGARCQAISGAAHAAPFENPDAVITVIGTFLNQMVDKPAAPS
jgi:pimeloyl-ACP methyl ester carboxylesterase